MAPHFPGNDSGARDFLVVGNVFGLDNVRKKLEGLDLANQKEVVESLKWEARLWMRNPISGPYGYHHSVMQRQQLAALQQRHHLQRCMALQRMALREQQQGQQQPVLLPLFPSDGDGNGRMGGHHQDHHMTIQENNGGMIMPRSRHDEDQDGVHRRAAAGGDHQHGRQSYQQCTEYQHHPHVFGSEHGREQITFDREEAGRGAGISGS